MKQKVGLFMKRLLTIQLVPGMIVAEDVLGMQKQLVVAKDAVLTDKLITLLDSYGILSVYVHDVVPDISLVPPAPKYPSHSQRIVSSEEFKEFQKTYDLNLSSFKDSINRVVEDNIQMDVDSILQNSLDIISNRNGRFGILDMLQNMHMYDDSTYSHCMNVALICNILATWLKFTPEEVELATACGLFHDIGKLLVPHEIITKPGKLSDEEYFQVQRHPMEGYLLLLDQNVDRHVSLSALMHHENYDGSGYPSHITGEKIDRFASIVAIADVYDAMTAARVYRGPMCPFKVIEIFESDGMRKFHPQYLMTFMENVVNSYIQNQCRLSDGREGDIIFINKEKLSRPIVQCGREYVNLMEYPDLTIEEII